MEKECSLSPQSNTSKQGDGIVTPPTEAGYTTTFQPSAYPPAQPLMNGGESTPKTSNGRELIKHDKGKGRWSLLPYDALRWVVKVMTFGAIKYSDDGWCSSTTEETQARYEDALFRHYDAYKAGEILDPESGMPHLAHLATNALFILALWLRRTKYGRS